MALKEGHPPKGPISSIPVKSLEVPGSHGKEIVLGERLAEIADGLVQIKTLAERLGGKRTAK